VSIQLNEAMAAWADHHAFISAQMITLADKFVGKDLTTETAHALLLHDGAFIPFDFVVAYYECVAENGNADDECLYISALWQGVLAGRDATRYADILRAFSSIDRLG